MNVCLVDSIYSKVWSKWDDLVRVGQVVFVQWVCENGMVIYRVGGYRDLLNKVNLDIVFVFFCCEVNGQFVVWWLLFFKKIEQLVGGKLIFRCIFWVWVCFFC